MESFVDFLGNATNGRTISTGFDGLFDASGSTLLLIVGLSFFATNVVNNITNRHSLLEYATTFCTLLLGGLLGNSLVAHIELPVSSELAQTAVTANIGMTVSALLIMALYGREGSLES